MNPIPQHSPFKLLRSYEKDDIRIFFGRERETRQLYDALMRSKFMIVYGASGTGKTSLIQCGLQGMYSPRDWLPILIRRGDNFLDSIHRQLERHYEERFADYRAQQLEWYPDEPPPEPQTFDQLRDLIRELFNLSYVPVYLILDQFEEIFTLGNRKEQDAFFEELGQLDLFAEDLFCKILLITREEYIAHFYRYEGQLPFLFENRFRVEKMREEQLLTVVNGILSVPYAGYPRFEVEPGIPRQILHNLEDKRSEVDLTTLQVYLDRLYEEDLNRLTKRDYVHFDAKLVGDHKLENILSDFLDQQVSRVSDSLHMRFPDAEAISRYNLPLQVLFQLVTDQGTKQSGRAEEIRQQLRQGKISAPIALINACLEEFAGPDSRILNRLSYARDSEERYEIVHDRLAERVHQQFSGAELRRREAVTTIKNKHRRFEEAEPGKTQRQEYLSIGEVELVSQSLQVDAFPEEEKYLAEFFQASRDYHRARKRREYLLLVASMVATIVFFAVAVVAVRSSIMAKKAREEAVRERNSAIANELASRSFLELKNNDNATLALELAREALATDSTSTSALKALFSVVYQDPDGILNPFYLELDRPVLPIRESRFTPSGSHIVTQSDSIVQVWDLQGKLVQSLPADGSLIRAMDISYDDHFIALVYADQSCSVYDWQETAGEAFYQTSQTEFVDLAFHPAADELSLISADEIFRMDVVNRQLEKIADNPQGMYDLIYHPDGDQLITVQTGPALSLWRIPSGEVMANIPLIGEENVALEFSPNGDFVIKAGLPAVQIRDKEGTLKQEITHQGIEAVRSARFSPSGRYVITSGMESAKLHDLQTRDIITLSGHQGRVYGTDVIDGEELLLTYSQDGRVKVWNYEGEQRYEMVGLTDHIIKNGLFSKNGKEILMQIDSSAVRLFRLYPPQIELAGHTGGVTDVVILPDQDIIISSGYDGKIIFWSKEGDQLSDISMDGEVISKLGLSRDGKTLVAVSTNGSISFWDISDIQRSERWQLLEIHESVVNDIGFSDRESYFISIGRDGKTSVHPIDLGAKTVSPPIPIPIDSVEIRAFAFSEAQSILLTGNGMGRIKNWKLETISGRPEFILTGEIDAATDRINAISLAAENGTFWVGSEDGTLTAWDNSMTLLTQIRDDFGIRGPISVQPDYVIAPGSFGHLFLTDLQSDSTRIVPTNDRRIIDWGLNQEKDLLITAAGQSAMVWLFNEDQVQLDLLAELKGHTKTVLAIAIADRSDFLVTVSFDQKVLIWPLTPASMFDNLARRGF